jgi:hypothetical protein
MVNGYLLLLLIVALAGSSHGFAPAAFTRRSSSTFLRMAEEKAERKEVAFNTESGKLMGEGDQDCIPDEEFCILDKDTGKMIRLTLEEKERIFKDALQVSILRLFSLSVLSTIA